MMRIPGSYTILKAPRPLEGTFTLCQGAKCRGLLGATLDQSTILLESAQVDLLCYMLTINL